MPTRPGGAIATRPLHFIWLADCSGSMAQGGKIQALNHAVREALPHMRKVADDNPNASVLVRAITFATGARWHVATPTPVESFEWTDLTADGNTDFGKALRLLTDELDNLATSHRLLPPVLVLISDGFATDRPELPLKNLLGHSLGSKAVRVAIAIGDDADTDMLQEFIGDPGVKPLKANNPETLVSYIKWASTAVLQSASSPVSQPTVSAGRPPTANTPIPKPPPPTGGAESW